MPEMSNLCYLGKTRLYGFNEYFVEGFCRTRQFWPFRLWLKHNALFNPFTISYTRWHYCLLFTEVNWQFWKEVRPIMTNSEFKFPGENLYFQIIKYEISYTFYFQVGKEEKGHLDPYLDTLTWDIFSYVNFFIHSFMQWFICSFQSYATWHGFINHLQMLQTAWLIFGAVFSLLISFPSLVQLISWPEKK